MPGNASIITLSLDTLPPGTKDFATAAAVSGFRRETRSRVKILRWGKQAPQSDIGGRSIFEASGVDGSDWDDTGITTRFGREDGLLRSGALANVTFEEMTVCSDVGRFVDDNGFLTE